MRFERQFTTAGTHPYNDVPFRTASSEIRNPDGTVVFSAETVSYTHLTLPTIYSV